VSPFVAGPLGRCPRCGKGTIFAGFLAMKPTCEVCGLDLTVADTGDGPAFFASFLGSVIVLGIAVYAQIAYDPPFWFYLLVITLGTIFIVGLIRPIKGLLTALQYANKAAQGRFEP
jgi:uncharacterized protein (DUF983 family)